MPLPGMVNLPVADIAPPSPGVGRAILYSKADGYYYQIGTGPERPLTIGNSDSVPEGATNLYFTQPRVRATPLTGLSLADGTPITATDTVLTAPGKLQAQASSTAATLTAHTGNISNPHATTAAQVGADTSGQVDAKAAAVQAFAIQRTHHSGVQEAATISDFSAAADARITLQKGAASGITPLGADSKVAAIYLPSYVDDVVEVANFAALPTTGESGKLYVTLDTGKIYRWSGSVYVEISASPGSTDAVPEGASNLYFTYQRVRDALLTGLSLVTATVISATDTVLTALGKLQAQASANLATITNHTNNVSNPHNTTAAQVGAYTTAQTDTGLTNNSAGDRARANHSGVQDSTTISDFSTAADARITAQKGIANGILALDANSFAARANLSFLASSVAVPNNVAPVQAFVALDVAFADIDLALVPKGAGGMALQIADNAVAGGNKRGSRAVDLQLLRAISTQVASGIESAILGGSNNTASGLRSVTIGSTTCLATGINAIALGSHTSNTSGTRSFNLGATGGNANGNNGGNLGGVSGNTNARQNYVNTGAPGSGTAVSGRHQMGMMVLAIETPSNTATAITADAASMASSNQLNMQASSTLRFRGLIIARSLAGDTKEWEVVGLAKRAASVGSVIFVGTPTVTSTFADTLSATWSLAVVADTVNGAVQLQATGGLNTVVRWTARLTAEEVVH